jgi:hypothetical protein
MRHQPLTVLIVQAEARESGTVSSETAATRECTIARLLSLGSIVESLCRPWIERLFAFIVPAPHNTTIYLFSYGFAGQREDS